MADKQMENHDDSEDSLITQFETTLNIRPSTTYNEDHDISIDHTTIIHGNSLDEPSIVGIDELEEEEELMEQILNFRTIRERRLLPERSLKVKTADLERLRSMSPMPVNNEFTEDLKRVLKPSISLDLDLERFNKAYSEFLAANPHITKEGARLKTSRDKTLVLLSPYSPEHAFGRSWVTKLYLLTIFERPQRLLAACLGVSAALTMFPFYYDIKNSTKKGLIFSDHVRRVHGKTWPKKLFDLCVDSHSKLQNNEIEVPEDWNTGDIYLTPKTITALEGVIGTIETAVDSIFNDSEDGRDLAFVVLRPPGHHSHACLPSGFCLLNNAHIGVEYAAAAHGVTHCAILDIDLHHGDGSQDLCWERAGFAGDNGKPDNEYHDHRENPRNEYGKKFATYPKVGYFSLHDIKSYPTELGYATKDNIRNASLCIMDHDLNLWNVHLQEWSTEDEFYKHYLTKYVAILNRANQFFIQAKKQYDQLMEEYEADLSKHNRYILKPHSFKQAVVKPTAPPPFKPLIIISAGFDASEYENPQMQRHGICVPTSFYATFTRDVVKLARIHTSGKVISFLEGGYSDGALISGVFSHLIGLTNTTDPEDGSPQTLWNKTWGSDAVIKEICKGCKRNWAPYKNPRSEVTIWANEVIKMGRSMMPNAILPSNMVYYDKKTNNSQAAFAGTIAGNKMLRGIIDPDLLVRVEQTPAKDPTDDRRVMRHTRSYFKKANT